MPLGVAQLLRPFQEIARTDVLQGFADLYATLGTWRELNTIAPRPIPALVPSPLTRSLPLPLRSNPAELYRAMGRHADATRWMAQHAVAGVGSSKLDQGHADLWNNYGNALREKGRLDEAIASFQTALQLRPDHAHGGCVVVWVRWMRGSTWNAIISAPFSSSTPCTPTAYNNLGNGLKDKGLVHEATQCYAKVHVNEGNAREPLSTICLLQPSSINTPLPKRHIHTRTAGRPTVPVPGARPLQPRGGAQRTRAGGAGPRPLSAGHRA